MKTLASSQATNAVSQLKSVQPVTAATTQPSILQNTGAAAGNPSGSTHSLGRIPIHANDGSSGAGGQNNLRAMPRKNYTGLPDTLKARIEAASGYLLDDVRVHLNSSKPAQLQALAFTQGTEIHVGPGQEKHLPHEAWHVVQQKQRRVKPMFAWRGMRINTDASLEKEADVQASRVGQLGTAAFQVLAKGSTALVSRHARTNGTNGVVVQNQIGSVGRTSPTSALVQLKTTVTWTRGNFEYTDSNSGQLAYATVGHKMVANLDPADPKKGARTTDQMNKLFQSLKKQWNPGTKGWVRGHLLNANLGGDNVSANLFPITGHANGRHERNVEAYVKEWLGSGAEVHYEVTATQSKGTTNGIRNAGGSFLCYAYQKNDKSKRLYRTIASIPQLIGQTVNATSHNFGDATKHTSFFLNYDTINTKPKRIRLPKKWGADKPLSKTRRKAWQNRHQRSGWFSQYYQFG